MSKWPKVWLKGLARKDNNKNLEQFARKITVRLAGLPKVLGKG